MFFKLRKQKKQGGGFSAGTLVHTKEGLVPIEKVKVGDWVLSQPEAKGDHAYKKVLKTFSYDDRPVIHLRYSICRDGVWVSESLINTGNHPIWVAGFDPEVYANDPDWDDSWVAIGWTQAADLESNFLLELATGEVTGVSFAMELWRTREEGACWATDHRNDDTGTIVRVSDDGLAPGIDDDDDYRDSDYQDEEDFFDRKDDPAIYDKYVYKCAVYDLEVEDSHTYYVGTLGAWVHDTTSSTD